MVTSGGSEDRRVAGGSRGQSSVLGYILVVAMVLSGTAVVVMVGSGALGDVQTQTELERAEHSMTLFNSRAAMAALGDSPTQEVSFGSDRGSFETREGGSRLVITHANHTNNGHDEEVYNRTLGTVVYENAGTEIAYEGGGVWRKDPGGQGVMISPPEFHYRGATLTLPIVRVEDAGSGSGSTVQISRTDATKRVFPNASRSYEDSPPAVYRNPVANGTVNISVESPYYHGWAEYFRTNTDGQVTTFPDEERVRVTLTSMAGSIGDFEMPAEGNSLDVQGMGSDHPIDSFEITLYPDNNGNGNGNGGKGYNNMHWSFYADEGNEQLEIHFYSDDKCDGSDFDGTIDTSIYYYNSSGPTTIHEEWQNQTIEPDPDGDISIACDDDSALTVDLLGSTNLTYKDIDLTGGNNKWKFGKEISDEEADSHTTSFGMHTVDNGQYSKSSGDEAELGFLVNHYLQLTGPSYDLTVTDGPGGSSRVDESRSTGTLQFDTSTDSQYITYLHVTENNVTVDFR